MMRTGLLMIAALFYLHLVPVFADEATTDSRKAFNAEARTCPMTENTQVNINFNSQETDLKQVKSIIDDIEKEIETLAKEAGVEQFEMQSMNYNVHANNPGYNCPRGGTCQKVFQLNGNMSFKVWPSEKSIKLMVLLNDRGYYGGMNVNKYRQCR